MQLFNIIYRSIICLIILFAFSANGNAGYSQVITYTNDTGGVLNVIATHVTADTLERVNGSGRLSTPCSHGFSTKNFTTAAVYSDTLPAIQVIAAPNMGYILHIDSFTAGLRRSATGPANARYAYSTNSGTTWTDQGTDQHPYTSATCDSIETGSWAISFEVTYPERLMFRIYGYDAGSTLGNFQIMNLNINGTVLSATAVAQAVAGAYGLQVYPNPATAHTTVSYRLANPEKVSIGIYNLLGQQVSAVVNNALQQPGSYSYAIPAIASGVYFIKMCAGETTMMQKIVKL